MELASEFGERVLKAGTEQHAHETGAELSEAEMAARTAALPAESP